MIVEESRAKATRRSRPLRPQNKSIDRDACALVPAIPSAMKVHLNLIELLDPRRGWKCELQHLGDRDWFFNVQVRYRDHRRDTETLPSNRPAVDQDGLESDRCGILVRIEDYHFYAAATTHPEGTFKL